MNRKTLAMLLCSLALLVVGAGACSNATDNTEPQVLSFTRYGLLTLHVYADTVATLDFSAMGDSCFSEFGGPRLEPHDLLVRWDSLCAPYGIMEMGVFDSTLVFFPSIPCVADSLAHEVRSRARSLPCSFFLQKAPLLPMQYYYLRSREGAIVLLVNVGWYIGAIDRWHLFWAVLDS